MSDNKNKNDSINIEFNAETLRTLEELNKLTPDELAARVKQRHDLNKTFLIAQVQVWAISAKELADDWDKRTEIDKEVADEITEDNEPDGQVRVVYTVFQDVNLDAFVRNLLKRD